MAVSIQTNVNSIVAQENLRVTGEFQSKTIQRLTSGYRINSSGDDAAGLAVANKFRSDIAELMQGVRNANDGISTLQLVDGGLNNVSKLMDRLKTLASQSASGTFTGNRTTLNNEYQALLVEINRQAANIGLVSGGTNNKLLDIYIGGGSTQTNAQVSIDLSGSANQVDSAGLGIANTAVSGGGTALTGNTIRLDNPALSFLNGSDTQAFLFHIYNGSATADVTVTVSGTAGGISGTEVISQLNTGLASYGISASMVGSGSDVGELQFGGSRAFVVETTGAAGAGQAAAAASNAVNEGNYRFAQAVAGITDHTADEVVTLSNASGAVNITFAANGASLALAMAAINDQAAPLGIYAVENAAGDGFSLQSGNSFTILKTVAATTGSVFSGAVGSKAVTAPSSSASSTANALSAITALTAAVTTLGSVQGRVGTGQNKLYYSIQLAQSQIASFSAAEARIRDADIAAEAANLTKVQVLEQASLAAMAQANASPQSVLALLRG
jgi:flagellin-like hook-associated protein FlgL